MAHKDQTEILTDLKNARLNSGLTQHQLAKKTGIPRTTISKIEAGFRNTTLSTLLDLSKAVNLDLKLVKQNLISSAKKLERGFNTLNLINIKAENILFNFNFFANKFPTHEIWPVIKANAYGHGLETIALILKVKKPTYLVADSYFEALNIWKNNPEQKILLIGSVLPENFHQIDWTKTTLCIYSLESLLEIGKQDKSLKIHLKINTGMNRQGLSIDQIDDFCRLLKRFPKVELEGVMSHLADADNPDSRYTKLQEKVFSKAIEQISAHSLKPKYIHLDATAGSVITNKKISNAIRLGIGLYGYNPLPSDHPKYAQLKRLKPALSFKTKIVNIIRLNKGERVSYNGTFIAKQATTIGVLPVGYFDFYDRKLSNQAQVTYKNRAFPLVGKICMNMCMVDFGHTQVSIYDEVEIISDQPSNPNSISNLSRLANTVDYETLVKINQSTRKKII